ncbi:MAG: hypothetical protein KC502_20235 [Myxococcales bacterium]|nr:hypothetical protein [Myxococcales bacterium]
MQHFPQLSFTVEGQPNQHSWQFSSDTSGGQLTQQAAILVVNSGAVPLQISAVSFETDNPYMRLIYPSGKPAFPVTLATNERLKLLIRFKPDSNIADFRSGRLTIGHNDAERGPVEVRFGVELSGAKVSFDKKAHPFINPSAANPQTACFKFGNIGHAALTFNKAYIETLSKVYAITKSPVAGTTIGAIGQGNNPKHSPKTLEVCVRLTLAAKTDDLNANLVVQTSDKANPLTKLKLLVKWQPDNVFTVSCAPQDGSLTYDFSDVASGSAERCCSIANHGPGSMVIHAVAIAALDGADQQLADMLFGQKIYKVSPSTGEDVPATLQQGIHPGKSLKFCVQYTPDTQRTAAAVVVNFAQASGPAALHLPVVSGPCDTPTLLTGPSESPLWMQTTVGDKVTKRLVLANQSCAPLQILQACATAVASAGNPANPCGDKSLLSLQFGLDKAVGLTALKPWGQLAVDVSFNPSNANYPHMSHFLNVVYCPGKWSDSSCAVPLATRTVALSGVVHPSESADPQLPTLQLSVSGDQTPKAGQPFKIVATASAGDWPIGEFGAYQWVIAERPASSSLWLGDGFQSTNKPQLTLVPDVPGTYKVVGRVQAVDETSPSNLAWSTQVELGFVVK